MLDTLVQFYDKSHIVTLFVLLVLCLYFIAVNWIFFYRLFFLNSWIKAEEASFDSLIRGSYSIANYSYLNNFIKTTSKTNKSILSLAQYSAVKEATKGLSFLSIVASTTPFIGLFGTVVSILDTFDHIGSASGTMGIIAAGVSDALVATASGIFVAIFAYTYHQLLKRKGFEISTLLQMQSDVMLSKETTSNDRLG